jgi:hypothetical protein
MDWLMIITFNPLVFIIAFKCVGKFQDRCKMCGSMREEEYTQKDFLKSYTIKYRKTIACKKCGWIKSKDSAYSDF